MSQQQQTIDIPDPNNISGGKKKGKKEGKKNKKGEEASLFDTNGQQYELLRVQPKGKYDVKMHMTNERTFFKYLFASFHLGAIGTFLLQYYSQPSSYKPILIGFIWLAAFCFILLGLYTYYQRRQFLLLGRMKQLSGLQMNGPAFVLGCFFVVFIAILIYSMDKLPSKSKFIVDGLNSTQAWKDHQLQTPTPFTTMLPVG